MYARIHKVKSSWFTFVDSGCYIRKLGKWCEVLHDVFVLLPSKRQFQMEGYTHSHASRLQPAVCGTLSTSPPNPSAFTLGWDLLKSIHLPTRSCHRPNETPLCHWNYFSLWVVLMNPAHLSRHTTGCCLPCLSNTPLALCSVWFTKL